jgi:type II secretory ATPase GspE/PulE/Tfp pilus assembly ATPase PilB-like protein
MTREEIKKLMNSAIEKNKSDLDMAKIEPFSPENQFFYGKNGLILFIAPQGGGKSYTLSEFILLSEKLFKKPFFQNIIYCSTNDGLDKTLATFKK